MLIRHSAYKCLSLENIFLRFQKYTFLSSVFILSVTKFISNLYNSFKKMWDKSRILDVELQRRASSSGAYSGLAQRDIKFGDRILTLDIRSTWNKKT